ncbi:hypothetical protein Taro_049091 [Colocasia esculenta]|uniref:Putative plant transposon protein domain-containing protein n=1 Tax=Colocasia esculenta TaxID=4460 RepID=A0A843XA26_COLES|nr:hypothetical protein [Colocasia esculenta]
MAPKQAPRRGARSRATSRPILADDAPPTERRTKRRHDPAEQPGPSSASPPSAKRGRTPSVRGRGSTNRRRRILVSSPEPSESSSSGSSHSSEATPTKSVNEGKTILKPRAVDLTDNELIAAFSEVINFFKFQSWMSFISEFRTIYPRLVQEFYSNLECNNEGYKSEVKGVQIVMPIAVVATLFKVPDVGTDYHNFEFNLHEAYSLLTGLPSDESDIKQTHVTKFNTNTFPLVLRLTHYILTTIITPQGGGRDRLTDIQRCVLYCMKKNIKVNIHVIMYQIISETTRKNLHRSLPYAAHLTSVFKHFGVPSDNEKSQAIPKSNIYCFKHVQKFMGFRLEGDQVRRGPAVVEAPVVPEDQPPAQEDQPPAQEDQPPAQEDQPPTNEGQLPVNEDQPHVENEVDVPLNAPLSPQLQPSSSLNPEMEIPSFTPQPQAQTSYAFGGPSVPPELYSFLNEKFDAFNTSIQQMTENFELKVQRLENTMSAKFIEQKAASDHAVQRFNRLIGTLADASIELKEHQEKLETVLQGILANSQADVFNTKETLSQISKTRLSFAHLVDDLESMKNLSAHIDEEMSDLKKEFKSLHRPGGTAGTNFYCKGSVNTPHTGVDTMLQALSQKMKKWSTSVDTSPSQVDTLRKLYNLKFLLDTWHPRELMDWPWIVCPRTPRVPLDYLEYKCPPIGHPTQENLFRASQKSIWQQEEFPSLLLLSWCFLKPILICPSMRSGV